MAQTRHGTPKQLHKRRPRHKQGEIDNARRAGQFMDGLHRQPNQPVRELQKGDRRQVVRKRPLILDSDFGKLTLKSLCQD